MEIRKSTKQDIPVMKEIFEVAKQKMRTSGNTSQWEPGYPSISTLENDIDRGFSYVIEDNGKVVATFVLAICPDPTYKIIYQGKWLDDVTPYGTIHRIASINGYHGIMRTVLDFSFKKIDNIRIDTHRDNKPMIHLMLENGFTYCGIIRLENERGERIAYQKVI